MISAATLEKLMAAGLAGDDLLEVVRSIEADTQTKPQRSSAAVRQQRYRERKNAESVTDDVTRDVTGDEKKVSPDPFQENPTPKEKTPKGVQKKGPSRQSRIGSDWTPSQVDREYAAGQNFSDRQISQIAESFRDHHASKGTTMLDWSAAWRTWVRNEIKFGKRSPEGATLPKAGGWPLPWAEEDCRKFFLRGSWPPALGCPAPGQPGCKVPTEIQQRWQAEKAAQRSAA